MYMTTKRTVLCLTLQSTNDNKHNGLVHNVSNTNVYENKHNGLVHNVSNTNVYDKNGTARCFTLTSANIYDNKQNNNISYFN